jgi:hypothetical protein
LRNASRWFGEDAEHDCPPTIGRQTCKTDDAGLDE